nr:MAG TPA: hypothetical protein [Bacteriophage sp.]
MQIFLAKSYIFIYFSIYFGGDSIYFRYFLFKISDSINYF